jgi:site-specific DNA-adenine methylase
MNRFIRDMTKEDFEKLKKKNWTGSKEQFDKVKASSPTDDVSQFYKLMYQRYHSFASGDTQYSKYRNGITYNLDKLWKTHERLAGVKLNSGDYIKMIDKYDSPDTLFYLDPPYPKRAFVGQEFEDFTEDKLIELIDKLKGIKGKFILSLGVESTKSIPKNWNIKRVQVHRRMASGNTEWSKGKQYEILASKQEIKPRNFSNVVVGQATEERRVKDKRHRIRQWGESAKKIIGG